jgi:hypothetical protein
VRVELVYLSLVVVYREEYTQKGADLRRNRAGEGGRTVSYRWYDAQQAGRGVVQCRTGGTAAQQTSLSQEC